jgi:hypothetical protein
MNKQNIGIKVKCTANFKITGLRLTIRARGRNGRIKKIYQICGIGFKFSIIMLDGLNLN